MTDLSALKIYFLGIGGSGMSGLVRLAAQQGALVCGADMRQSPAVMALLKEGFSVDIDGPCAMLPEDCNLLVISAAVADNHKLVIEAREKGIEVIKYAQMLGRLMLAKHGVAVAGTHGKSTTTSILSHCLIEAGLEPSFIIGARCQQIGGGSRCGHSDILVAEACEFDRSFHHLRPAAAVILNVEADHLDIYDSLEEIVEAFAVFAGQLPGSETGGYLLINHEMPARLAISSSLDCAVETIGFSSAADWQVKVENDNVCLLDQGVVIAQWKNPLPGDHMAYNAGAAAVLAHHLGARWKKIAGAIEKFAGLDRRMQLVGTMGGKSNNSKKTTSGQATRGAQHQITIIDDYAHHPTEIDATLGALKNRYQPNKLICIFQPHQHSRTRFLMEQFAVSFSQADLVIVPDIYFVRDSEQQRLAITAEDLVNAIKKQGREALYIGDFDEIVRKITSIARPGDLIVTMGAGDVWKIAEQLKIENQQAGSIGAVDI